MNIEYLSHHEAAQFHDMIHEDGDLATLFGTLMVQMEVDTDYDTFLISFDDEKTIRVTVEDSPYIVVMDEDTQTVELYLRDDTDEPTLDEECDFSEDGVLTVVDTIASRVLGDETDGT
ncbi:MAG: hypothetical protein CMB99_00550 [Flavobacteriaceae bacterium]|nr:hypothetical protein [Flavobacteriaceae bacterium]|tara:strand:- start:11181 stop:11534 length:354 start_codon:yes stop_codon:yes gene_type:complete